MSKHIVAIAFAQLLFLMVTTLCRAAPELNIMVPMRDGIKLATDAYVPEGDAKWPVILMRTPYGKDGVAAFAVQANLRGYAFVSQDFRGRGGSEGDDYPVFLPGGWG